MELMELCLHYCSKNWATSRHLCCIFTACLARGYIPTAFRQVKVMFTLTPGRLTILRIRHIILLIYCPSCWERYKNWWTSISGTRKWGLIAYTDTSLPTNQVKSIETALHSVITHILDAVKHREITLKSFSTQQQGLLTDPFLKL